jgi:hypothetical protein
MNTYSTGDPPELTANHEALSKDTVSQAVRLAGPRPTLSPEIKAKLKMTARSAWQAKVEARNTARQHQQRFRHLALAATLLISAGLLYLLLPSEYWPLGLLQSPIATVEVSSDPGFLRGRGLRANAVVETNANARLALRLRTGASLRLDGATQLELHSAERLTLHHGAVYLDSGPGNITIAIETPYGIARDIGTQFEVRLLPDHVRIAVREGEVRFEQVTGSHTAVAGTALTVDAEGRVERTFISTYHDTWAWVLETTPPFELEGSSMWEFLMWVTRETGWHLQTLDPGLDRRLKRIKAHGSVEGLRPDEAIEVVLPGAGLEFEVQDGALTLSLQ